MSLPNGGNAKSVASKYLGARLLHRHQNTEKPLRFLRQHKIMFYGT